MKILVCGDRNWSNFNKVLERLQKYTVPPLIIQGGARGADACAKRAAFQLGYPVIEAPANWHFQGKSAGPIRNRTMLDLEPDLVIAFHSYLENSRGTKDTVNEARRRGIEVEVIK